MTARAWATSRYTGLFTAFDRLEAEPHDPQISMAAGTLGLRGAQRLPLVVGGAGWDANQATMACLGEALERFEGWLRPTDHRVTASFDAWPLDEPAVPPDAFALFTPAQYASTSFPFSPFDSTTRTRWVAFRDVLDGSPTWVPEDFAVLYASPGETHSVVPLISTGLAAGRVGDPVVLRGLQEVLERDAMVRAWWGEFPIEELDPDRTWAQLGPSLARRAQRPHLRYRFLRIVSPHCSHAVVVTTHGAERDGEVFSTGSAVRETRAAAIEKALLEALQGRHYVRYQLRQGPVAASPDVSPRDFSEHVLHYTRHPERLAQTVFGTEMADEEAHARERTEPLEALVERLAGPALVRLMTPPAVSRAAPDWLVVRVVVPGLVPLHADHRFAHLGHPFWRDRPYDEWLQHPPHPFA